MSSPYPVLNNRPIDQWKVTELKDELRRRKLKINGLKEELVRRLDGALRSEMEADAKEELANGLNTDNDSGDRDDEKGAAPPLADDNAQPVDHEVDEVGKEECLLSPAENKAEPVEDKIDEENPVEPVEDKSNIADSNSAIVENDGSTADIIQGAEDQDPTEMGTIAFDVTVEDNTEKAVPMENSLSDSLATVDQLESVDQDMRFAEKNEDSKSSIDDAVLDVSEPPNQVPEVSPDLEFQVKSESISTDSMSINEKNELKDNLNANNVHLDLEVVKQEMVHQPSSDVHATGGNLQPLEDAKDMVDNKASLEVGGEVTHPTDMELCKKIESVDEGSPEKLNLDRSSGDESIEEDVLESKQIESKEISDVGEGGEGSKEEGVQEAKQFDTVMGGFFPEKKDIISDEEIKPMVAADKRKAEDQETVKTNEPKRQRRWNLDPVKASEPQTSNVATYTPKDAFQPALRRSFTRSDSSVSGDAPKERIVPPSKKEATTSLRIDHFLRPFTLKAVHELLAKTGTVSAFWMDQIKTHCYVTFSSVDEAIATRNALYNLQWPTNGGKLLAAEFVDPQEVKMRMEGPPPSPAPVTPGPTTPTAAPFQRQPPQAPAPSRSNSLKQQQLPPPPPLPPLALSNPPPARERLPPPPVLKKPDPPPIMTLDDLFKKTKSTPRIYFLPLSEEQVAGKLAKQEKKAM